MSSEGISALERGYRRTPQRETLALLAEALALDLTQREIFETAARRVSSRRQSSASITVGPWPDAGTFPLPIALTSFIGRTTDITEIAALLRERRLVTLTGAGGIGKTQTALRVGSALAESGELAIGFVPFSAVGDASSAVTTIATALSVQDVPQRSRLELLIAVLKDKPVLLILDGCEHLIDEVARASQALLTGTTALRILATSREPLRAAGEYAYRLPALREADAVALFADRAAAVNHRFTLSEENGATVAAICRQLDGIPLAIELEAGRMNVLSVKALAERLSGEQSQTMRQSIESSYILLPEPQRRVFERLSTFDRGATLDETTAACEPDGVASSDVLGLIASLVDKSLVVAELETGEPRYRLLEASRQYAREKLSARM